MLKFNIHLAYMNRLAVYALRGILLLALSLAPKTLQAEVLWATSHETGDLADWYKDQGGGVYNTGGDDASVTVTRDVAHSGNYSVKMEVWNIDTQKRACRIFRWGERLTDGYFSCWLMFPTLPTVNNWLNIFQFKKKDYSTGIVDPTWYNEVKNKANGTLLTLTHWNQAWDITPNVTPPPTLSANEWFHVEWHYKDGISDGKLEIWINGVKVWNLENADTRGLDPDIQWSPCLYGINVTPGNLVMYMDDAAISTHRVGPNYFPSQLLPLPPKNLKIMNVVMNSTPF